MSMLIYPQLGTGALSQYPIRKRRRLRTLVNTAPDGSTVRVADPAAETVQWQLAYAGLADEEMAALEEFFAQAEGSLNGFLFLDPAGNLLAWSARLDADVWQRDPLLQVNSGASDPAGGALAWQVINTGAGAQVFAQTIGAPGGYSYCFSIYLRSPVPATIRMIVGESVAERVVTDAWSRVVYVATPPTEMESVRFGIEVGAGSALDVFGPQVEPQQAPSAYRATTRGGVYTEAHLTDDALRVTRTGCNRNSCTVNIIHANHL